MNLLKIGLAEKHFEYPKGSLVIADEPILKRGVKVYDPAKHGLNPLPMDYREAREFAAAVFPDKDLMTYRNGRRALTVALLAIAGAGEVRAQDAAAGEKVFGVCKTCHQIGETAKNNVGPVLNGLIGRKAGSVAGYSYSAANKDSGVTWDEATFREYIKDPKAKIPGTKMIYAGLKDEQKTNDLVAFLKQFDGDGKKK
jgi:cytochrome c